MEPYWSFNVFYLICYDYYWADYLFILLAPLSFLCSKAINLILPIFQFYSIRICIFAIKLEAIAGDRFWIGFGKMVGTGIAEDKDECL